MIVVRQVPVLLLVGVLAACSGSSVSAPRTTGSPSPTTSPSASPPTKTYQPAYGPEANQVASLSWQGSDGWALVGRRCGSGHLRCATVFHTVDGGASWRLVKAPAAGVYAEDSDVRMCARRNACVSHIVFAGDATNGYLFGRSLYATHDGGRSWHWVKGPDVETVATDGSRFFRIAYDGGGCPGPCNSRLQVADVGSDDWRAVSGPQFNGYGSQLLVAGGNVYVVAVGHIAGGVTSHAVISVSHDGGSSWTTVDDPCGRTARSEVDTQIAAAAADYFVVHCVEKTGGRRSWVMVSDDAAQTFGERRPIDIAWGPVAVDENGAVAVTDGSTGEVEYTVAVSADGGRAWTERQQQPQPRAEDLYGTEVLFTEPGHVVWVGYPYEIWQADLPRLHFSTQAAPAPPS